MLVGTHWLRLVVGSVVTQQNTTMCHACMEAAIASVALLPNSGIVLDEKFQRNASKGEQNFCFLTFLKVTDLSS